MQIGYCGVSADDQTPDLQLAAFKRAGSERIFTDMASGATTKRPELTKCPKALNAGDVLTVWKLDRLGRSLRDFIRLLDDMQARGVAFPSLTKGIDTATPIGCAMWQMVMISAGPEPSLMRHAEEQAGRRQKLMTDKWPQALTIRTTDRPRPQTDRAGEDPDAVAGSLQVSRSTIYGALH